MNKLVQAKSISDEQVLLAIQAAKSDYSEYSSATLWRIREILNEFPPKVVLAKLRALTKRKVIDGCCCGCRGDFRVLELKPDHVVPKEG